jgi:hypothetical protein
MNSNTWQTWAALALFVVSFWSAPKAKALETSPHDMIVRGDIPGYKRAIEAVLTARAAGVPAPRILVRDPQGGRRTQVITLSRPVLRELSALGVDIGKTGGDRDLRGVTPATISLQQLEEHLRKAAAALPTVEIRPESNAERFEQAFAGMEKSGATGHPKQTAARAGREAFTRGDIAARIDPFAGRGVRFPKPLRGGR